MRQIPFGDCLCGCGNKTQIAKRNDERTGEIKGQPRRFVHGHNRKKTGSLYTIEDRGYKTPCWIWKHSTSDGYGQMYVDGRNVAAHVVFYREKYGDLPAGKIHDHLCRVRACVNPDHVEGVTYAVNNRRGLQTKLTEQDVQSIRTLRQSGMTQEEIGQLYGVCQSHISRICSEQFWRLTDAEKTTRRGSRKRANVSAIQRQRRRRRAHHE